MAHFKFKKDDRVKVIETATNKAGKTGVVVQPDMGSPDFTFPDIRYYWVRFDDGSKERFAESDLSYA
jgi:hypothetical protein